MASRLAPLGILASLFLGSAPGVAQDLLAIRDVTVIDGSGGAAIPSATVLIEGSRILAVSADAMEIPRETRMVEGEGKFLIPGLWDMHTHLSKARSPALPLLVASGVLGVRDAGGDMAELQRWESEIHADERAGPRIVMAGPYLESPANVLRVLLAETVEPEERTRIPVDGPSDARRVVDSIAAAGADLVKVRTWRDLETFRAIAVTARERGLPLAAHVFGLPPEMLREGLVSSIEHFVELPAAWTREERLDFYADLGEKGTVVVATLATFAESVLVMPESLAMAVENAEGVSAFLRADWREQLADQSRGAVEGWRSYYPTVVESWREMREAGMRLLPGSDLAVAGILPGASLHRNLALMVEQVGLSPMEAIVAGTRHSAEYLGLSDSLGVIAPGMVADLVLLDADPLADIRNTARVAAVIQEGRLLDRAALDSLSERALRDPAIVENDWLPRPATDELVELRAHLEAIDAAGSASDVTAALGTLESFEGAAKLPVGPTAVDNTIEAAVNRAGYRLLRAGDVAGAIEVFRVNADMFPTSANAWDSLAEAHMERGDRVRAIEHYRRSLELDPGNDNARERLEALGAPEKGDGDAAAP
ncbi:MAG TPA: amidohydrolase family protein [Gemmatimonadota bacterium]|nr:amidohydrolase family protein [Gemmatimonadota bacterium]